MRWLEAVNSRLQWAERPTHSVGAKAAARIGRDPDRCFVVEDAHVGIQAGRSAGMKTIAVTTTHPAASFSGESAADWVVDSLEAVSVERSLALFAS